MIVEGKFKSKFITKISKTKHCVCMILDTMWCTQLKSETRLDPISRENEKILVKDAQPSYVVF